MTRFEQFTSVDAFDSWIAALPELTQAGLELVGGLDGSVEDRLRQIGTWIVDNHDSSDALLDEQGQRTLHCLMALAASVLAEGVDGFEWTINLDDPSGANYGLPVTRILGQWSALPHSLIAVTAHRGDTEFLVKRRANIEEAPTPTAASAPIISGGYRATILVAKPTGAPEPALAELAERSESTADGDVYRTGDFALQVTVVDRAGLVAEFTNAVPLLQAATEGIDGTPLQPLDTYTAAYEIVTTPDPDMDHFNTYALAIQAIEANHDVATTLDHATLGWT